MPDLPAPRARTPAAAPDAREQVVERLSQLFADDQITAEDLEARLERVYHAASGTELEAIVADLPSPGAGTAVVPAQPEAPRVAALLGAVERQWTGAVPRRLEVRGRLGYVELDLTRATFEPGVTVIDARAFMGYVQLRLPAGVQVESRGHAFAGFFSLKGASRAGTASPCVVQIVGRAAFGFVEGFVSAEDGPRLGGPTE